MDILVVLSLLWSIVWIVVLSAVIITISEWKVMDRINWFQEKTKVSDSVAWELFQGPATSFPQRVL